VDDLFVYVPPTRASLLAMDQELGAESISRDGTYLSRMVEVEHLLRWASRWR
jgi:hypothetical protein